jgi:hypothetical protein
VAPARLGVAIDPQRFIDGYLEPEDGDPMPVAHIHRDIALHGERVLDWSEMADAPKTPAQPVKPSPMVGETRGAAGDAPSAPHPGGNHR